MPAEQIQHSERPRIGFYHPYPQRMGGSQLVALLLARKLPATGYEPVIICPEDGSFTTAARQAGIEVLISLPDSSWRSYGHGSQGIWGWLSLRHARELVRYWFKLRRLLREQRIVLLHCHNVRSVIMAAPAGSLAAIPTVWHVHGDPTPGGARWLDPLLGLAVTHRVFVSQGMIDDWTIPKWMLGSRQVIQNGLDIMPPATPHPKDPSRPLIVVTGVLHPRKGHDLLLSALPQVLTRIPGAQCWFAGKDWSDGSCERQLRERVSELNLSHCVEFLGERRDVPELMAASDCVVVPSRAEPFGMVVLEGMMQEKPVVAARTGGIPDIVVQGETGFLVRAEQTDELADAIIQILSNPDLAARMGKAGRRRAIEKFSSPRMTQQFAALYDEMLRPRPPGVISGLLARLWYGAFMRKQWTIGVSVGIQGLDQRHIERIKLLPPLRGGDFLADPFIVPDTQGRVMLCEWMRVDKGDKGAIARIELNTQGSIAELLPIIERGDCHLSYPYTFKHEGRLYCCPEAAESGEIRLYELSSDARRIVDSAVLVRDFPAIDPTLFQYEGRWWLFCTSAAAGRSLSHLYAFHAPQLHGPWTAHSLNPIVVDVGRARPAGTVFQRNGQTFRPGQDCRRMYGAAIRVSRIVRLTPDAYEEEPAWTLHPLRAARGADGIHTLSVDGDIVAIDACEHVYDPLAWASRLRRRMRA